MNDSRRSLAAETLIVLGLVLAFLDETVRKALPETPVLVTAVKDVAFLGAGFLVIFHSQRVPRSYGKYFIAWVLVTFASAVWVFTWFHSLLFLGAILRTYCLLPVLFAVGYYLGLEEGARRRVAAVFIVGGIAAIAVAFAQELARESLPSYLSTRIYRARHGGAGGEYNESLFASPQTLSQVALVLAAWSFASLALPSGSRHRLWALGLLLASVATVYLSRIRTAFLILGMVIFTIWVGVWKVGTRRGEMPAPLRGIIVGLGVLIAAAIFLFVVYPELRETADEDLAQDIWFYENAFDLEVITVRSGVFLREFAALRDHDWFFGHGAGTGGQMRDLAAVEYRDIPAVSDTGLYLLYHELGILGVVTFLFAFIGLALRCARRMATRQIVPAPSIPAFAIAVALLFWFLLKSHTCIANGFSRIIWMGALGACCALLDFGIPQGGPAPRPPGSLSDPGTAAGGGRQTLGPSRPR